MYSHVLPCITMYSHVLPCIAMYYHLLPANVSKRRSIAARSKEAVVKFNVKYHLVPFIMKMYSGLSVLFVGIK